MPVPALCPGHASRLAFPSTGRLPSTVSAADPRPALFEASSVLCSRPTPPACLRGFARSGFPPRPAATNVVVGGQRSPRFRRVPFQRDVVFDSGRATAPRLGGAAHVAFSVSNRLGLCEIRLFGAQYTPHGIAVYASSSSSPTTTQHSLPGDALPSYPGRTFTGWTTPASPGALERGAPNQPDIGQMKAYKVCYGSRAFSRRLHDRVAAGRSRFTDPASK